MYCTYLILLYTVIIMDLPGRPMCKRDHIQYYIVFENKLYIYRKHIKSNTGIIILNIMCTFICSLAPAIVYQQRVPVDLRRRPRAWRFWTRWCANSRPTIARRPSRSSSSWCRWWRCRSPPYLSSRCSRSLSRSIRRRRRRRRSSDPSGIPSRPKRLSSAKAIGFRTGCTSSRTERS